MANIKKFLDSDGLTILCRKFQDYPDNEILGTVINAIDNIKVDKVEGKNLSTNDYTNEDKNKLDSSITFNEQNLSDEQQAQARTNITAVSATDYAPVDKTDNMTQLIGKDANGKLWTAPCELPTVTIEDAGKFLRVSSTGEWNAESMIKAEEESF